MDSVIEQHLGNEKYAVVRDHEGEWLVHVRQYTKSGNKKFPTKTGVTMRPVRYAAFVSKLKETEEAFHRAQVDCVEQQVHIGGRLFALASPDFPCIHLRYVFKDGDGKIRSTKQGITLRLGEWEMLRQSAPIIHQLPGLCDVKLCSEGDDHLNQIGYYTCKECMAFPLEEYKLACSLQPSLDITEDYVCMVKKKK